MCSSDLNEIRGLDLVTLPFDVDPFDHGFEVLGARFLAQLYMIQLAKTGARNAHALRQFGVIGEEKEPCVHPLHFVDRQEHFLGCVADEVHDGAPPLLVPRGAQKVLGLVEDQVPLGLRLDALSFDKDFVGAQYFGAQRSDDFTIDRNGACRDEEVGLFAGADSGVGTAAPSRACACSLACFDRDSLSD